MGRRSGWFSRELALDFQYIDAQLPPESPHLYGLHPNAEIGFLTQTSEKLFRTVLELQPRDSQAGEGAGAAREEKVRGGEPGPPRAPALPAAAGVHSAGRRRAFPGSDSGLPVTSQSPAAIT